MKTLQEFQAFYAQELQPKLATMQAERNAARPSIWRVWRWWLLGAVLLTATIMILSAAGPLAAYPKATLVLPLMWAATLIVVPLVLVLRKIKLQTAEELVEDKRVRNEGEAIQLQGALNRERSVWYAAPSLDITEDVIKTLKAN